MDRPNPGEYHPNYQKYFDLVPSGAYVELLRRNSTDTVAFFDRLPQDKHDYRYAPGKWSSKELLMHLIDTERVFAYRALAAARGDETPVYRMDEELYARGADYKRFASSEAKLRTSRSPQSERLVLFVCPVFCLLLTASCLLPAHPVIVALTVWLHGPRSARVLTQRSR